ISWKDVVVLTSRDIALTIKPQSYPADEPSRQG
ncbi:hypothetical protein AAULR_07191, partial [Lacticaseibacillus rhamnosus MTCC 5462]